MSVRSAYNCLPNSHKTLKTCFQRLSLFFAITNEVEGKGKEAFIPLLKNKFHAKTHFSNFYFSLLFLCLFSPFQLCRWQFDIRKMDFSFATMSWCPPCTHQPFNQRKLCFLPSFLDMNLFMMFYHWPTVDLWFFDIFSFDLHYVLFPLKNNKKPPSMNTLSSNYQWSL